MTLAQSTERTTPVEHVEKARALLSTISDASLKKNARERVQELRKLFDEMAASYPSSPEWRTKFSAVESQLTRIIGGGRGEGLEATLEGSGITGGAIGSGAALGNRAGTTTNDVQAAGQQTGPTGSTGQDGVPGQAGVSTGAATGVGQGAGTTAGQSGARATGSTGTASGGIPSADAAPRSTQAVDTTLTGASAVGAGQTSTSVGAGSGVAVVGEIGMKDLDPMVREQLRAFRLEVELFFASALTDNFGVATKP
jgi:hypothetical protein